MCIRDSAGLVFEAGNPADCARKVCELADNPASAAVFADSGYRYVMQQGHNWEDESALELVRSYDELFGVSR